MTDHDTDPDEHIVFDGDSTRNVGTRADRHAPTDAGVTADRRPQSDMGVLTQCAVDADLRTGGDNDTRAEPGARSRHRHRVDKHRRRPARWDTGENPAADQWPRRA